MVKKHKTPLMLINKDVLKNQFKVFKKYLPGVEPYFAIKSNSHPEVVKTFVELGSNFDVASGEELKLVLNAGAKPSQLMLANTIKSKEDILMAKEYKCPLMTFDNSSELDKIKKYYPQAGLILRIKVENIGSIVELSLKFGAAPEIALLLLKKAKKLKLNVVGLSFHVGSQCINLENYLRALEVSSSIFYEAKKQGIAKLKIMDIGGGFPIQHFENENIPDFESMATTIHQELHRLFYDDVRFIAEPGRFFVGTSGTLITQVIGKTNREDKPYYYLNDGVYGDFSGIVFDHCQYEFKTFRKGKKHLSTLAGPTCDSFDTISYNVELPKLDLDDLVYVNNIGAYSIVSASPNFNGFRPAKVVIY